MVKQGEIIQINFNSQKGYKQAEYRSTLVVSNNFYNKISNLILVCPITNSNRAFPLHISLDNRIKTIDYMILSNQSLDLEAKQSEQPILELLALKRELSTSIRQKT